MLKQVLLFVVSACFYGVTFSQDNSNPFMADADGRPLYQKTEYIAEGSPYFYDEYCMAEVVAMNGKVYPNIKVKVNLIEKLILYMADDGTEMIAAILIHKIKFTDFLFDGVAHAATTLQSINGALNSADGQICQVLEEGAARLLTQITVTYSDKKGYGEATITRAFSQKKIYFAMVPEEPVVMKRIEKNKASVEALFGNKKELIHSYIEKEKLGCRSEEDLIKIFRYYNSN